ncbi:flagellar hook-length control protein FliK [Anaeromassilibacillus sp. An200]|uniref:flagellar hook-length control protein FliK n=1 Tax=Anaeromassilibacillus sp. An200 TaxID=1965587 RepID=UPI000B3763FA|nr:flagellar hook-length control protein FliK [Anaeromassilibacillus sp. An200]OUP10565.1 hypothetical protein B5F35_11275 [Anaeromassilibacillus sp. An200]
MNAMDLVMQMSLAAAQIAQNTIPQVPSQQASESGQDFKTLMEDKRAQDSQNSQKTQDSKDSEKPQGTETDDSAGKTEEPAKDAGAAQQSAAMQAAAGNLTYVQVLDIALVQESPNGLQLVSVQDVTQQAANPVNAANAAVEQPVAANGMAQQAAAQQQLPEQQAAVQQSPVQQAETQAEPVEVQTVQAKPESQQAQAETFAQTAQDDSSDPDAQAAVTTAQQPFFSDTENMPVKVGNGDTIDTQQPDFDAKLTQNVEKALSQGEQRVEIRLNPENLGSVVVEMTRSQDGSLHVVLHTETESAARLLSEHSSTLGLMLQNNNQGEVRVEVRQPQQENQQWQHPDQDDGQNHGGQQREQQEHRQSTEDFLQQLRLGLFSVETQDD